jgi:hypothetical protein
MPAAPAATWWPACCWPSRALSDLSRVDRARVTALELVRDRVPPDFRPTVNSPLVRNSYLHNVDARSYFSALEDYGSPAYSLAELRGAPLDPRRAADLVLAAALGAVPLPGRGRAAARPGGPGTPARQRGRERAPAGRVP